MSSPLVTVRTPSCLPAFGAEASCLGLALDGWNTAEVWPAGTAPAPAQETDEEALARRSMESVSHHAGNDVPSVRVVLRSDASPVSTVGSREASIVAGLVAANRLAGSPLRYPDLLRLGAEQGGRIEGLASALLGGLQMSAVWEGQTATAPVPLPLGLTLVLFLMEEAPALPASSGHDSRHRTGLDAWRAAMLVNAMASSRLEDLAYQEAMQPANLYPDCAPKRLVCAGAMIGGALASFPADDDRILVALTRGKEMTIAYEMAEAARQASLPGTIKIAKPSTHGAHTV